MRKLSLRTLTFIGLPLLVIIFTLTSVLCASTFVTTNQQAKSASLVDSAVTESCTIAETLKAADGNLSQTVRLLTNHKTSLIEDNILTLYYDDSLLPCIEKKASYKAVITVEYSGKYNHYYVIINSLDDKLTLYSLDFKYLTGGN